MQFKANHSPGPWTTDKSIPEAIGDKNAMMIGQIYFSNKNDKAAIVQVPTMLEYMMERAKEVNKYLNDVESMNIGLGRECFIQESNELSIILEILKDAGVEVVE